MKRIVIAALVVALAAFAFTMTTGQEEGPTTVATIEAMTTPTIDDTGQAMELQKVEEHQYTANDKAKAADATVAMTGEVDKKMSDDTAITKKTDEAMTSDAYARKTDAASDDTAMQKHEVTVAIGKVEVGATALG